MLDSARRRHRQLRLLDLYGTLLTEHQRREAIKRRDEGVETLAEIGRSYNVSVATISRLTA